MPLTKRQLIEARLARGVMSSPQFAETVIWYPLGVVGNAQTIANAFVDRIHEEGTNESVGDGATPRDEHGLRFRTTYLLEIPISYATQFGDKFLVSSDGLVSPNWVMQYVRGMGRDSAKQTLRIVYSIPSTTRQPVLSPNARPNFNRSA